MEISVEAAPANTITPPPENSDNIFNSWKHQTIICLKFIQRFGAVKGLSLFLKIKSGRSAELTIPGIKYPIGLRPGTSDIRAFTQIFLYGGYDIQYSSPPKIIIDGGANIGLFAILMKNRFPEATIICVEPDPENFEQLKKNINSYSGILAENCGIWNKDTLLHVYDKYNMGKWCMVVEENAEKGNVPAICINSLMTKHQLQHIDVLKLDIETSEKNVFEENYEYFLSKTRKVIIELHDWIVPGCSQRFFNAINKSYPNYSLLINGENVIIEAC